MRSVRPNVYAHIALAASITCASLLGGCARPAQTPMPGAVTTSAPATSGALPSTDVPRADRVAVPTSGSVPPGKVVRSKGRASYTFREEWRRAIPAAQKWDPGAYLVQAFGSYVDKRGIPTQWTMHFRSHNNGDLGILTIDRWGTVTEWRTMPAEASGAKPPSRAILPTVIDSSRAISVGTARLADYAPSSLSQRQAQVRWAENGSGMRWFYVVYHAKSHKFISVEIDALSGKVKRVKKYEQAEIGE